MCLFCLIMLVQFWPGATITLPSGGVAPLAASLASACCHQQLQRGALGAVGVFITGLVDGICSSVLQQVSLRVCRLLV